MIRAKRIRHEFVEFIPSELVDDVLYVSIPYTTAVHRCLCGCGEKVVTPLTPTDWAVTFDGETVSLWPSIGNWSFRCQSHYWIEHDEVTWAPRWSRRQIEAGRQRDRVAKDRGHREARIPRQRTEPSKRETYRRRFFEWWRRSWHRNGDSQN